MGLEIIIPLIGAITINFAQIAASIAVSVAIGFASTALFKPKGPRAAAREIKLNEISARPVYRRAYGTLQLGGFVTERRVTGRTIYLQILLQSGPSAGPFDLYLDGNRVPLSGDPFDFTGPGALSYDPDPAAYPRAALYAGHVRAWIGLGDQTGIPADITTEHAPLGSAPVWPGFTVLWLALNVGDDGTAGDRWPGGQPVATLEGQFSPVYDPRDLAQSVDDPGSWTFSDNQALIVLDMLRDPHCVGADLAEIELESFAAGADVADIEVETRDGGREPLYRAAGVWAADGGAAFEMIEPALAAGMSALVEVDGQWRFLPGRHRAPERSYGEDVFAAPAVEFVSERDPSEVLNAAYVQCRMPSRNWELQPLGEIIDGAALEADNYRKSIVALELDWVTSIDQAYRIGWRVIQASRLERSIAGAFHPEFFEMHTGAVCEINCTLIWGERIAFTVEAWSFGVEPVDQETGTARLAISASLRETSSAVDIFDAAAAPLIDPVIADDVVAVLQPPAISAVAATFRTVGATVTIRATITAVQSTSESATGYDIRWRGYAGAVALAWQYGPQVPADDLGAGDPLEIEFGPLELGVYDVELRSVAARGFSPWVSDQFTVPADGAVPSAPTLISAASGSDHETTWQAPDDPTHERLVIWSGVPGSGGVELDAVGSFAASQVIYQGSGASGVPVSYYATSRNALGADSAAAGPSTHTTP